MEFNENGSNLLVVDLNKNCYSIPLTVNSSYKPKKHLLFIFSLIFFGVMIIYPMDGTAMYICKVIFTLVALFFLILWLYNGVLKKAYIKLDEEGITIRLLYLGTRSVQWGDILDAKIIRQKNTTLIGITTKQKLQELKEKQNPLSNMLTLYNGGVIGLGIPLDDFSNINTDFLFNTIHNKVQSLNSENNDNNFDIGNYLNKEDFIATNYKSNAAALLISFIVSIIAGILYGFSINLLEKNFIAISLLGLLAVAYVYFKYYNKSTENIFHRILFGIICALQVLIAPIAGLTFASKDLIDIYGFWYTVGICATYITENPVDFIAYFILAIAFFIIGIDRKFYKKIMYKKQK